MELMIKGAIVAVTASVLGLILKKSNPELTLLLALTAAVLVLLSAFGTLGTVRSFIIDAASEAGIESELLAAVMKCVGISVTSQLASDICRDCGQSAAGGAVETVGTIASLYTALPLAQRVLDIVEAML